MGGFAPERGVRFRVWMPMALVAVMSLTVVGEVRAQLVDPDACGHIVDDFDYMGFGPDRCAPPNVRAVVTDEAELARYHTDFGRDPVTGKLKNLMVLFNPSGDVEIHSPCRVLLAGENGILDIVADNVRVFGKKGVEVATDSHGPDVGIVAAGQILLVSERGSAAFGDELFLGAENICVQARDNAMIGADSTVDVVGAVELVSRGEARSARRRLGTRGVAGIRAFTRVTGEELRIDGPIAAVQRVVFVNVAGNFEMQASTPEKCRLDGAALILAGTTSGNCLDQAVDCPCWDLDAFRFFDIDSCKYDGPNQNAPEACAVTAESATGANRFFVDRTAEGPICGDDGQVLEMTPITEEQAVSCCEILIDATALDGLECQQQ